MSSFKITELEKVLNQSSLVTFKGIEELKQQMKRAGQLMDENEAEMKGLWNELSNELEHIEQELLDLKEEFDDRLRKYLES